MIKFCTASMQQLHEITWKKPQFLNKVLRSRSLRSLAARGLTGIKNSEFDLVFVVIFSVKTIRLAKTMVKQIHKLNIQQAISFYSQKMEYRILQYQDQTKYVLYNTYTVLLRVLSDINGGTFSPNLATNSEKRNRKSKYL